MGYDRSYLSKIENGQERPTHDFAARAEQVLKAGGALTRAWREGQQRRRGPASPPRVQHLDQHDPAASLVVEHDEASLTYDGRLYKAKQRRWLYNGGTDPVAQYLIRISVDRHPGSPERSNQLYRENPLTWMDLDLHAFHAGRDPMTWSVRHDRDAFKELWLLFENEQGRFPLYPGDSTMIEYSYYVSDEKWGNWFQRTVRLPTRRLSVQLDFPADLDAAVWDTETTMSAAGFPLRTAITRTKEGNRRLFCWSTEDPPLHARYRLEWTFRARDDAPDEGMPSTASETMSAIGIVQQGDPVLTQVTRPFDLPTEAEDARRVVAELQSTVQRVAAAHPFSKGVGLAAPQVGIDRAVAVVRTPNGESITLLNPRIIESSVENDEQYEGCLSFFDVRGMVPRPLEIGVEHQHVDGQRCIMSFQRGVARLVAHEIDHLNGMLYTDRMRSGVEPIPITEYHGTGRTWQY
jgi:peptide deformylase